MTTFNKATLKTFFETNDVPFGGDYANLIDSQVNIAETAPQSMAGLLQTPELVASRVSAGNANFTGTVSAANLYATKINNIIVGGKPRQVPSGITDTMLASDRFIYWNSSTASPKKQVIIAGASGQDITVKDYIGTATTYNITLSAVGCTLDGSSRATITQNQGAITYKSDGNNHWMGWA